MKDDPCVRMLILDVILAVDAMRDLVLIFSPTWKEKLVWVCGSSDDPPHALWRTASCVRLESSWVAWMMREQLRSPRGWLA